MWIPVVIEKSIINWFIFVFVWNLWIICKFIVWRIRFLKNCFDLIINKKSKKKTFKQIHIFQLNCQESQGRDRQVSHIIIILSRPPHSTLLLHILTIVLYWIETDIVCQIVYYKRTRYKLVPFPIYKWQLLLPINIFTTLYSNIDFFQ